VIARITVNSQAAAIRLGRQLNRIGKTLQGMTLMLHKRWSKSKGETPRSKSIHTLKAKGRLNKLAFLSQRLSFA
jgi:hypothetical protein